MRFSEKVRDLTPSQRREIRQLAAARTDVVDLGRGDPDFSTPPAVLDFLRQHLDDRFTHYSPPEGFSELRTALAERLTSQWGQAVDPQSELIITAGAQEAIYAALATLVGPGDEVVSFSPCYASIAAAVHLAGAALVRVPLREEDGFLPDPEALEARLGPRSRLLVSVSPHNPTGRVWPEERLRALGECARRHDLWVLSDEIYGGLTFDGLRHRPMAALPGLRPRTITIGGFSKTYAMTGWRVGFLAGPAAVLQKILQVHYHLVHCASGVSQLAALGALVHADNDVAEIRQALQARRDVLWEAMEQVGGLRCVRPDGSLFAFPGLPDTGMSSLEFARFLVSEVGLAVVPGTEFGPEGEGYIRLSLTASAAAIREGVARLAHGLAIAPGSSEQGREGQAHPGATFVPQSSRSQTDSPRPPATVSQQSTLKENPAMAMHKNLSDRLVTALHLETTPVAVLWTTKFPEGVPHIEVSKKGCQFLDVARFERRTFYTDANNHADCKNGRYYLGFTPAFEGLECGDWPGGDYPDKGRSIFRSPVAFRRTLPHYAVVPSGTVTHIVFGPLDDFPYGNEMGGVVVNVFCTAKAGLFLARAAVYEGGGVVQGPTGPSTCSMVMSRPLMTGEVTYTLGCFGFRQFVQIKPEEVVFGIPLEKLPGLVDNLELLLKRRPDLVRLLAEPVGQAHVCTEEEIHVQKAPGNIVKK